MPPPPGFRVQQQQPRGARGAASQPRPAALPAFGDDDEDGAEPPAGAAASPGHGAGGGFANGASGNGFGGGSGSAAPPAPSAAGTAEQLKRRGVQAAEGGDYIAALHAFGQALQHGEDARLHEMRAQVLLLLGRDFEAVQSAERATRLQPEWSDAWLTLARANLNLGEPQLAVEALERLSEADPGHEALRSELPEARMLALRQRQQQQAAGGGGGGGVRMHVVSGASASGAAAAELHGVVEEGEEEGRRGPAASEGPGGARGSSGLGGSGSGGGGEGQADEQGDLEDDDMALMEGGVDMTARVWQPNVGGGG